MSKNSEHTSLGWYLGILAVFFEIYIGLTYILSPEDQYFAIMTIAEGGFALAGLLFIDAIYGKRIQFKPDHFKKPEGATFLRMIYILGTLTVLQILMQFPLTVREWHRALAIVFAGPAEELFFRGLLLTPFIIMGRNDVKLRIKNPIKGKNKYLLEITPTEIAGIILSSMVFMVLHINYYGNITLLITVFLSGVVLGLYYIKYRDLTANILAHFLLNLIVVGQSFFLINF